MSCQVFPCGELSPKQKFMLTSKAKPGLPCSIFPDPAIQNTIESVPEALQSLSGFLPFLSAGHTLRKDRVQMKPPLNLHKMQWTRKPSAFAIGSDSVEITTAPHTDLWQRTYYHFRNDNAPVLQLETEEKFFSFVVKADFSHSCHRFDQCGIVMYLDSENWLKASVEYENQTFGHLGSVVTNMGYSDWATTAIPASVTSMWYRLSRREDDYCIECSPDGTAFSQMRVCHMWQGGGPIRFGIYACSPEDSSFTARFSHLEITECQWPAHHGQPPDKTE